MKIDLKDFDIKQFLLHRGEWVGLALAVLIALPALFYGVSKTLGSGSPRTNADQLAKESKRIQDSLKNSKPPDDAEKPPPESDFKISFTPTDFEKYATANPWFVPSALEDTKRREPVVLGPSEFHINVRPVGFREYLLDTSDENKPRVGVIVTKEAYIPPKVKNRLKRLQQLQQLLGNRGAGGMGMAGMAGMGMRGGMGGMGGMGMAGMAGMGMRGGMGGMGGMGMAGIPGMGMAGVQGMGGGMGMGMRGGMTGLPGGAGLGSRNLETSLTWVDVDQLSDNQQQQNRRLAEVIQPARMVVLTGSFPIKQQLEEFRKALRLPTLNDLLARLGSEEAPWRFRGFIIERRTFSLDGRQKTDWEDVSAPVTANLVYILARTEEPEPEDEQLTRFPGIENPGLVMTRPRLARGEYPKVELQIKGIKETVDTLAKAGEEKVPRSLSEFGRKLRGKGIDPYNPFEPTGGEEEQPAAQPNQPNKPEAGEKKPGEGESGEEPLLPENALVRLIDTDVQPGNAYEYRLKLRMDNPNYKQKNVVYKSLAEDPIIKASEYTVVPGRAEVPYDVYWYATDEHPAGDQVRVQIHRWLEAVKPNPDANQGLAVADWTILDKFSAYRGEYIGRPEPVKVPVWDTMKGLWVLARNTKTRTNKVAVDFTVERRGGQEPALLIDYQGGRLQVKRGNQVLAEDNAVPQLLVLTPEGKLAVHSTEDDLDDSKRKERYDDWKKWVEDVERGRANLQQNPQQPGFPAGGGVFGGKGAGRPY